MSGRCIRYRLTILQLARFLALMCRHGVSEARIARHSIRSQSIIYYIHDSICLLSQIQTLPLQTISIGINSIHNSEPPSLFLNNFLPNLLKSSLISPKLFLAMPSNSKLGSKTFPSILIGLKSCLSDDLGEDPTSLFNLKIKQFSSELNK